MPKKKVDSQQGIRLELQESERDMLRFYTTSAAVRNVGIGVGAVALPACLIAAGIFVAAIIDKGYDALSGDLRNAITERQNRTEEEWVEAYNIYVRDFAERKQLAKDRAEGAVESTVGFDWIYNILGPDIQSLDIGEPIPYDEWREKTDPERTISLTRVIAGGLGSIATFGLSDKDWISLR